MKFHAARVSISRRAHRVHHVRQPVQGVVLVSLRRADGIGDIRQIAHMVVRVTRVVLGCAPAVGQLVVRVILVFQDHGARLIQLVGHATVKVVTPLRGLALAVRQRQQISRRAVRVTEDLAVRVRLANLPPRRVIGV